MNSQNLCCVVATALLTSNCSYAVTIPTVPIGNPGNAADARYPGIGPFSPDSVGSVPYRFRIGKTEVTNAQYVEFLNAVAQTDTFSLYDNDMASETWGGIVRIGTPGTFTYAVKPPTLGGSYTYENKPVVYVSWFDALRFANWMHNGQPRGAQNSATTEDGAYTFPISNTTANPRNSAAQWWLAGEDEWYKAAYFDGESGQYYDYPTGTSEPPNNNLPANDTGNSANFEDRNNFFNTTTGNFDFPFTDAGAYTQSPSPYGTFDQGGNVWEWIDAFPHGVLRGGSWDFHSDVQHASVRFRDGGEFSNVGFRLATVPEPVTAMQYVVVVLTLVVTKCKRYRCNAQNHLWRRQQSR